MKVYWDAFADIADRDFTGPPGDVEFYLKHARKQKGCIIDIGCGTGRVGLSLIRAGYDVIGIDPSRKMLALFKKKFKEIQRKDHLHESQCRLINEDALKVSHPFDVALIIMAYDVLLAFLTRNKQMDILRKAHYWLVPGGLLIIDVFRQKFKDLIEYEESSTIRRKDDVEIERDIHPNFDTQVNTIKYIYGRNTRINKVRWITKSEGLLMLENSSFKNIKCYGGYNQEPAIYDRSRLIYLARR